MIKNLIFDFGKVLVDYDFEAFFHRYIPDEERCKAFTPLLNNVEIQQMMDREDKPFEEIIEHIVSLHPDFEPEMRIFSRRYPEIVTNEIEGMRALLEKLKREGYKIYGLSNWCSKVYVTMAQYDIFKLLDGYVISSEEKVIKPEAEIYRRLFKKYDLRPEECVFTDDKLENILGSEKEGMRAILFKDAKQYEKELRQII